MPFKYDLHGWFVGGVPTDELRTVATAPPSTSTTTTEGEPRANWSGLDWVMRPYAAPPPTPEPEPVPELRHVAVLGFRLRFTKAERGAIEWAAVDRADQPEAQRRQAAELRATLADQAAATYIDLDDPETVDGVQGLEAMGLLAPGRALEILNAPIQPKELP